RIPNHRRTAKNSRSTVRHFVATLIRWTQPLYVTLAAVWVLIMAWQVVEHRRVRHSARAALINRSQDITTTFGLVIRSQRRFGIVSQERLESALTELVKAGELNSVALLNAANEVVASAGPSIDLGHKGVLQANERWGNKTVTMVNLVDLGANVTDRRETNRPTIVMPRRDPSAEPREGERARAETHTNDVFTSNALASAASPAGTNHVERNPFDFAGGP